MAEAAKEKVKEKMKEKMDLEANGSKAEIGSPNWMIQKWNLVVGSMSGSEGLAKAKKFNEQGQEDVLQGLISEIDKRKAFYEDVYNENMMPSEREQFGNNSAPFADRYDNRMVPFATQSTPAPMPAQVPAGKSFSIGKVESNITINTTNLGQSTAQTQQLITDTIMKGIRDVSNVGK